MKFKINLTFSIFLMLMLTHVALSRRTGGRRRPRPPVRTTRAPVRTTRAPVRTTRAPVHTTRTLEELPENSYSTELSVGPDEVLKETDLPQGKPSWHHLIPAVDDGLKTLFGKDKTADKVYIDNSSEIEEKPRDLPKGLPELSPEEISKDIAEETAVETDINNPSEINPLLKPLINR